MVKDSRSTALVYDAFGLCFHFLSQVYLEMPRRKFIEELIEKKLFFKWPVKGNQKSYLEGLKILQDFSRSFRSSHIATLQEDYTRLFIGLETTLAPPYASVYLSEDHLLYEQPVFEMRRFYDAIGLCVHPQKKEPDDHVGFQLYCVSDLCRRTATAAQENAKNRWTEFLSALREFLSSHLNTWLEDFLLRVRAEARTALYFGVALVTSGLVENLMVCLDMDRP